MRAAIVSIAEQFPTYGHRMITEELKRRTFAVNTDHVYIGILQFANGLLRFVGIARTQGETATTAGELLCKHETKST